MTEERMTEERLREIEEFVREQNGRLPHARNGLDCHVVADLLAHLSALTRERDEARAAILRLNDYIEGALR